MPAVDLTQLNLAPRHLETLRGLLAAHVPQAEVWAYGSRVNGPAHQGSNLDMVLRNPADLQAEVKGWGELQEALQESDLPMLVETHIWGWLPPSFQRNIEARYVILQTPK